MTPRVSGGRAERVALAVTKVAGEFDLGQLFDALRPRPAREWRVPVQITLSVGDGFLSAATVLREQDRHGRHPAGLSVGTTATSNRSTTAYGRSASTATIGMVFRG